MSPQVIPAPDLAARGFVPCRCGARFAKRSTVGGAPWSCGKPRCVEAPAPAPADVVRPRPGQASEDALAALLTEEGYHVQTFGEYLSGAEHYDVGHAGIVRQYPWGLTLDPARKFKADFAQPTSRALVEIDGGAHRATEARRQHDVKRRQLAESVGYRVLALLPDQVKNRDECLALLRRALLPGGA